MKGMMSIIDASRAMGKNGNYLYQLKHYFGWPDSVPLTYIKHNKGAGMYFDADKLELIKAYFSNKKTPNKKYSLKSKDSEITAIVLKEHPQNIRFD